MLAQPWAWAGVGAAKAERNHSATAGLKRSSGSSPAEIGVFGSGESDA